MGKKKPSTRAGQYKQASRQRASRKRRKELSRSAKFVAYGSAGCMVLIVLGWIFMSGTAAMWKNEITTAFYEQTGDAGFELTNVYLSGHDRLSKQAILHHSQLAYGQPILDISLPKLQERLESLPQIRRVQIVRQLPNDLHIHVQERYPIALWQEGESLHLIDDEGVLMGSGDPIKHNHLPLLVGSKAPMNLNKLMVLLDKTPGLKEQFDSAVFVGNRRWNLWLTSGIEIKLPEENTDAALAQLETLHSAKPLKGTDISSIDLRVPERMFIRPKIKLVQQAAQQL
ncbi:MAG: FtsQ-type POTRA domain-containing protein [Rickettsiales bacterium]|nr:FtsQ-type POTRA domain-containing protein [Rickettsiales bacterium]